MVTTLVMLVFIMVLDLSLSWVVWMVILCGIPLALLPRRVVSIPAVQLAGRAGAVTVNRIGLGVTLGRAVT